MHADVPKARKPQDRTPRFRALRRSLGRTAALALGVLAVQAGHNAALGAPDPDPVPYPGPPPALPYPNVNPIVPSEAAGNLAGSSSVTPTGQYTYRIPIDVPPGRAGMQPSLALTYTSGGGNGLLGVGWSLEGLSEIRRCNKTKATDGLPDGVDFDETDSFCLDGQRLRQVNGADVPNGLDGAEYRTERDSFAKITAHGDVASGPNSFTVQSRNGQIFDYEKRVEPHRFQGGFDEAAPEDLGEVRAVWLISQARDQSGNKMRYAYDVLTDPSTHGVEVRIKSITYTETHDGQKGQRSVEFHYTADRADPTFRYESGVRWETNRLLDKITLEGPNPSTRRPSANTGSTTFRARTPIAACSRA